MLPVYLMSSEDLLPSSENASFVCPHMEDVTRLAYMSLKGQSFHKDTAFMSSSLIRSHILRL